MTKETLLSDTGLSKRIKNACFNAGITTVGDLVDMHPYDVAKIRNLGGDSLGEIEAFVKSVKWDERMNGTEGFIFCIKDEVFIPCINTESVPVPEEHSVNLRYVRSIERTSYGKAIIHIDRAYHNIIRCRIDYDELIQQLKEYETLVRARRRD